MADRDERDVPAGAAVFPLIPPELDIHPLLLAVLHATVFLSGSAEEVVDPDAAAEAEEYLATYLQRLRGPDQDRVRVDMETLWAYAKQERWPKQATQFLKTFLNDYGVGDDEEPPWTLR